MLAATFTVHIKAVVEDRARAGNETACKGLCRERGAATIDSRGTQP